MSNLYRWVNLFALAQVQGFVYYEAYVFVPTATAVGWITRTGLNEPYNYSVYYEDAEKVIQTQTRGTWQHAQWAVQGAIASNPTPVIPQVVVHGKAGVDLPSIYRQCQARTAALSL